MAESNKHYSNGVEVHSSNPQELQTLRAKFDEGSKVEVCLDDEHWRDAWFPATLLKQINDNQFLVEYESMTMLDLVGKLIETVDSFHIRPSPLDTSQDKTFNLLEKVEAFYDCGWWSGVVNRVLAGSRYIVFFKHRNEQKEFTQSELRCHMDWTGGKWVKNSKDIPATAHIRGQTKLPVQTRSQTSGKTCVSSPPSGNVVAKKVQSTSKGERLRPHKKLKTIEAVKTPPSLKHCHVGRMSTKDEATAVEQHNIVDLPKWRLKLTFQTTRQETECLVASTETLVRGHKQSPTRGRSQVPGDTVGTQAKGHEQATPSKETTGCVVQREDAVQEVLVDATSLNNPYLAEPLQMCIGKSILPPNTDEEGVSWPFEKESPFWEVVESLKVFQVMPQKPHFRPLLDEYRIFFREGQAIGSMLTFANLVEDICELKGDEPISDLQNKIEALPRLEALGFNVEPIKARLKGLLTIKDKQEQLNLELMATREHLSKRQHNEEKLKLQEGAIGYKIDEMENKIKELQQSLGSLKKEMESTATQKQIEVSSISELKRSMDTIEGQIGESRRDFYSIKSAPWGTSLQLE